MQDTALTAPNAEIRRAGVDLNGLMTVLGKHLYSTPVVALRELVQNAHDSIIRRRIEQPGVEVPSRISVQVDAGAGVLRITDTGAGLTRQESMTTWPPSASAIPVACARAARTMKA
jgi:molecular chaperone HtpG